MDNKLNAVGYKICGSCRIGFMLARLPVLTELKQRISDEWDKIDQQLIDSAVLQPVFLHEADT